MSQKKIEKNLDKVTGGVAKEEKAVPAPAKKGKDLNNVPVAKPISPEKLENIVGGTDEGDEKEIKTASLSTCVHNPKVFEGTCGECSHWEQTGFGLCMTANGIPGKCLFRK